MKKVMKDFDKQLERERERERETPRNFTRLVLGIFCLVLVFGIVNAEEYNASDLPTSDGDWYNISTCSQLQNMKFNLSGNYRLVSDVDCSETREWLFCTDLNYSNKEDCESNTAWWGMIQGFFPIGNSTKSFSGHFDGKGYLVNNLWIYNSDLHDAGLFGLVSGSTTHIKNVGLENVSIYGMANVGGLVGKHEDGLISNSYSTGNVMAAGVNVGGLIGWHSESIILDSYSMASASGSSNVGGLVGMSSSFSSIINSYATGDVTGTYFVGGLVGYSSGTITGSYYDSQTSGQSVGIGGSGADQTGVTGLTTAEMKNHSNFIGAGWDFLNVWGINIENNSGYPFLRRQRGAELVGEYVTEIELSEGWNLFSISRNYTNENATRNITLKQGFNFVGYSGNGSLNFDNVGINGTSWKDAVGSGVISSYVLGFGNNGNGFYAPFMPTSISKNQGYIIYSFSNESVNMTIKNTFGNDEIEYRLRNIRVLNRTSGNIYFFEEKRGWFYPIGENKTGVYEYNENEDYEELGLDDKLKSWESYWIRARYENLSLVIYG